MTFGSVCSGIEAASVAWLPLGWKAKFLSEIDPACRSVLKHHYPETKLYGDFTTIGPDAGPIDVLVGGTPCQSFSIAGLRGGMGDERGNLALEFLRLADRLRPTWILWENVPGVLSSVSHDAPDPCPPPPPMDMECDGAEVESEDEYDSEELHSFDCFLAGLAELGYGFSYRICDAQYAGVPQRRRRVFVVGHLGDWRRAAAVLFERHSLSGYPPPSRKTGENVAPTISARTKGGGGLGTDFDCDGGLIASTGQTSHCLNAGGMGRIDYETETLVTHALTQRYDSSEDGCGRGTPLVPVAFRASGQEGFTPSYICPPITSTDGGGAGVPTIAFSCKDSGDDAGEISPTLRAMEFDKSHANAGGQVAVCFDTTQVTSKANRSNPKAGDPCHPLAAGAHAPAIAFHQNQRHELTTSDTAGALKSGGGKPGQGYPAAMVGSAVRRLTPLECCRLQGFPDDYFDHVRHRGKPLADGPRYKMLGNSMCTSVVRWIGERIEAASLIP